jgi:hypothetical protein
MKSSGGKTWTKVTLAPCSAASSKPTATTSAAPADPSVAITMFLTAPPLLDGFTVAVANRETIRR